MAGFHPTLPSAIAFSVRCISEISPIRVWRGFVRAVYASGLRSEAPHLSSCRQSCLQTGSGGSFRYLMPYSGVSACSGVSTVPHPPRHSNASCRLDRDTYATTCEGQPGPGGFLSSASGALFSQPRSPLDYHRNRKEAGSSFERMGERIPLVDSLSCMVRPSRSRGYGPHVHCIALVPSSKHDVLEVSASTSSVHKNLGQVLGSRLRRRVCRGRDDDSPSTREARSYWGLVCLSSLLWLCLLIVLASHGGLPLQMHVPFRCGQQCQRPVRGDRGGQPCAHRSGTDACGQYAQAIAIQRRP